MTDTEAYALANQYGFTLGADFHTLSAFEVESILLAADARKYRKPKNANGSRGRYFYAQLMRAIRPRAFAGFINTVKP